MYHQIRCHFEMRRDVFFRKIMWLKLIPAIIGREFHLNNYNMASILEAVSFFLWWQIDTAWIPFNASLFYNIQHRKNIIKSIQKGYLCLI
jgi:hypothetical protein